MTSSDPFHRDILFSRMLGIVSQEELDRLGTFTIAVPGCGGVGFTHAEALVRMGIGGIRIADFDEFGPENFNRQFGATIHTVGRSKAEVLKERLLSINPALRIRVFDGVSTETIDDFLDGVDMVCDAMDYFVIQPRRLMYAEARRRNLPVVVAGPIGFGATVHLFEPDGMSFDSFFDLHDDQDEEEMLINFGLGLNPAQLHRHYMTDPKLDFEARKVASVSASCLLATTLSTSTAIRRLLGHPISFRPVPWVQQIDYVAGAFVQIDTDQGVTSIRQAPTRYIR